MGLNFVPSSLIYADTSIFIYTMESHPDYWSILQPLWQQFSEGKISIITSELTLMEVLVLPIRNYETDLINDYEILLSLPNIKLKTITQSILKKAAEIRANFNLKTPDAIHAATAILNDCTVFFTNDRGFGKVADLPVMIINEVL
jgi:predicted nucleic acid-binding protein